MENTKNYFEVLNSINVSDKVEQKNGLSYLSWAWAWGEVKKVHPDATYQVYENMLPSGYTVNYFTDGRTGYVKTGVTINGIEHIEYLPIMDFKNKSIPYESITSFDVNKAIQRSLTKAVARHGLGLYIYAGEDLPEEEKVNPEDLKPRITQAQIKELEELNVNVVKLVDLYNDRNKTNKTLQELPSDFVGIAIEKKRAYLAKQEEKNKE